MKILYYFPEQSNPMMQWQRVHIFDELSHYGIEFEVFNPLLFAGINEANETLLKLVKAGKYDLFLSNLCNDHHIYASSIEEIKKIGIPTLCFRSDNLTMPYNDKDLAKLYDLVWLTSKETQYLYKKWGARTMFAPYAANPFVYQYKKGAIIRKACFIGSPYGSRAKMINAISQNGYYVDLYYGRKKQIPSSLNNNAEKCQLWHSPLWQSYLYRIKYGVGRKLLYGAFLNSFKGGHDLEKNSYIALYPSVPFDEMIQLYSNYSLALSFTSTENTDVLNNPVGRTFLRTFEIPMSGGIQICRYFDELNDYFDDGKEIIMYKTNEELIDKVRYIMNNATDAEIICMKKAARKRSESEHSWMNRFKIAFDYLGLKY